ncbi:MAG TPA: GNAT family N-acetyltransferase [Streptosporangiaceae bacterium]
MPIRTRRAQDLGACVAMLRRVHDGSGYPARWPDDPAGWLCPPGLITAWVAEQDGAVAGHVGLVRGAQAGCLLQATGREAHELAGVVRLFVDPAARRTGQARELLATAAARAVSASLVAVLDVVDDARAAIAAYEQSGWRLAGRERAPWSMPSGLTPTLRYYVQPPRPAPPGG